MRTVVLRCEIHTVGWKYFPGRILTGPRPVLQGVLRRLAVATARRNLK
jgi:hypothetical protein